MERHITHDREIREPLFDYLEEYYGRIRILQEKMMGRSRADIVMVLPESLCGIEIKSDADTYRRLAGQVRDYDQYYDYNIVAAGASHAMHIREHVPEYWGIITVEYAETGWDFYFFRRPAKNPKRNLQKKMEILWRPELALIQQKHALPKYKDKSRDFVTRKILERVPDGISEAELSREISSILFERDYTTVKETLAEYRRGEIERQLEAETDPERRLELMMKQETFRQNRPHPARRRRRTRRRHL